MNKKEILRHFINLQACGCHFPEGDSTKEAEFTEEDERFIYCIKSVVQGNVSWNNCNYKIWKVIK